MRLFYSSTLIKFSATLLTVIVSVLAGILRRRKRSKRLKRVAISYAVLAKASLAFQRSRQTRNGPDSTLTFAALSPPQFLMTPTK